VDFRSVSERAAEHDGTISEADAPTDTRKHLQLLDDPSLDSCPSVTSMTERIVAVNWIGVVVELHADDGAQRFHETVCLPHVKNRPCQFVADRFVRQSCCTQQYSYAYAIGRRLDSNEKYTVQLIRVESGCKCRLQSTETHDYQLAADSGDTLGENKWKQILVCRLADDIACELFSANDREDVVCEVRDHLNE